LVFIILARIRSADGIYYLSRSFCSAMISVKKGLWIHLKVLIGFLNN